jgi:TolA-binding protein
MLLAVSAVGFLSFSLVVAGQEGPKLETLDQYTRLQIPITSGSSFRMLSGKSGEVTLVVDRVATGALEALAGLSDSRISGVKVHPVGLDKAEVTVRFQSAQTESFAYQQGNILVLDLWKGAARPDTPAALPKQVKKVAKAPHPAASARAPASKVHEQVPHVPQVEPLRISHDLFLKFLLPMPELAIKSKDGGYDLPLEFELDKRWKFSKGDKSTDDGRGFEFAKKLFAAQKYGLCLKSIEILLRDHPESEDLEELKFLRALAYKKLGESTKADYLVAKAATMLEELAAQRDEDGKPLAFQKLIVLHFAKVELEQQHWLKAIQHLEQVSSGTKPSSPEFPYVQMLLAESYSKVSQPRRAERLYRYLVEKYPKHPLAKEAYYRIGDLLAQEKNYGRVTDEGLAALRAYPEYEKTRSELRFHIGEAYFWLGDYAKAERNFRRFTEIASASTTASLAWVRLGEIEEVSRGNINSAHAHYLKAKNGYPFSKGDVVATVRLARIDLPAEKEPTYVVRNLRELLSDKTVDWELKRIAELTLADYMLLTGEIEKAISLSSAGMAQTDGMVYSLYKRAYEKSLFAQLNEFNRKKKYAEALGLYERERKWLENYGPATFRVMAEVYRGIGLYASANKLVERYGAEVARNARSPAAAQESARLRRAKAYNSFAQGAYSQAVEELSGMQDGQSSYLRAVALFRLGRKQESYASADRALPQLKENGASKEDLVTTEMAENLAEVLIDRDTVDRDFARMERDVAACRALNQAESERLTYASADALWYQKRHKEAEKAYKDALEKYPKSNRADRARYNLGISMVSQGKRADAVKLLTDLKNSGQNVWAESAKQELELIEWERKYSSVLRTLPPSGLGIAQ